MIKELKMFAILLLTISILTFSSSARAQGGPPMLTDDPATPGDGMWEINFLSTLERSHEGWVFETPIVDLNYGFGTHLQFKLEVPWVISKENGEPSKGGLGNSMAGVKWRFIDDENRGFDMSIYPQLEFNNPTNSVARGLADKGVRFYLPVEASKAIGPVEVTGELGYRIVNRGANEWEYGILAARQVTTRVEVMAELHGSSLRAFQEDDLVVDFGSRFQVSNHAVLLFSAGRTIGHSIGEGPQYIAALGIQFNFIKPVPR